MICKYYALLITAEKKPYYLVGNLNINCYEYFEIEKVSTFYSSLFKYGAIALINKPMRAGTKSATLIDHVIAINIFDKPLKKGIIASNLLDHLPFFFSISTSKSRVTSRANSLYKTLLHIFNEKCHLNFSLTQMKKI